MRAKYPGNNSGVSTARPTVLTRASSVIKNPPNVRSPTVVNIHHHYIIFKYKIWYFQLDYVEVEGMSKRSYGQRCTVAKALDVVGERWTLLLVRELLTGPKRYKDLLEGLPGIGTNLLAARLKALEERGLVRRATLPPPAGSGVYELTGLGRSLEPVVVALSRWGSKLVEGQRDGEESRPAWAAMALRSVFGECAGTGRETYEVRIDGEAFQLRIDEGSVEVRQGPAEEPEVVLSGRSGTFLALAAGHVDVEEALRNGEIQAEAEREALERCLDRLGAVKV
jgi:DNA-binding HxlR family transcriptional regulator